MEFTEQDIEDIKARAAKHLADRAWDLVKGEVEEIVAFSPNRAAGMLDVSTSQFNRIAEESLDMGGQTSRYSLRQLRELADKRKVRKQKAPGA